MDQTTLHILQDKANAKSYPNALKYCFTPNGTAVVIKRKRSAGQDAEKPDSQALLVGM